MESVCDECGEDYSNDEIRQCSLCGHTIHMNGCGDDWEYDEALCDTNHRSGDLCLECYPNRKESPYYNHVALCEYRVVYANALNGPYTLACDSCNETLVGDSPEMVIQCFNCWLTEKEEEK